MKLYNRIVLPVDDSELSNKAVKKAMFFAKHFDIPIISLYVVDMNIYSHTIGEDQVSVQWENILIGKGESILNEIKEKCELNNIHVTTKLAKGIPSEEIIKVTKDDDLIIMASKQKTSSDRIFIGSVSEKVLHHSNASVMIVR